LFNYFKYNDLSQAKKTKAGIWHDSWKGRYEFFRKIRKQNFISKIPQTDGMKAQAGEF
jgi:hypothetical protein